MFNKQADPKIEISYITTFSILDLIIIRLNRGMTLQSSLVSVKESFNDKDIADTFYLVESDLPIIVEGFHDISHFYVALLEVLRQTKGFETYKICDILVILKSKLQHQVYYGDRANTFLFSHVTPVNYAKSIIDYVR